MANDLVAFAERIARAHDAFRHRLGWRFLYSPARTLSPQTRLAFIGLNPGGGTYHPPIVSVETGNAYRVERWSTSSQRNPLQMQIGLLYDEIADRLSGPPADQLMDDTLALNFCPFRSASWDRLASPEESIEFSTQMWVDVLEVASPTAIICLGDLATRHIARVLERRGDHPTGAATNRPAGWGSVTYGLQRFSGPHDDTLVVRLPHLSRFGIFGRAASSKATADITTAVANAIG